MTDKVVLAFSGGLDTSVCVKLLEEEYDVEVITACVDVGQGEEEMEKAKTMAAKIGGLKHYNIDAKEEFIGESFGRINKQEALLTLAVLELYFEKIGKQRILEERIDVGVISPYRAQVQYLRQMVKKEPFFKPYRSLISINTVDGFQGQERDIILISLVRNNPKGDIGFLRDLRRMNVAITRARMKLIILGDKMTLSYNDFYKKLYAYSNL
jgi:superfamily I DNA and/or RNA helicase